MNGIQDLSFPIGIGKLSVASGCSPETIRYYERARMIRGDTPEILNPLAAEYFADQQLDKAESRNKQA